MTDEVQAPLTALEEALDYAFADPALLEAALTHASFRFEHAEVGVDYQRLEFLGDAVLNLLTAEHVFHQHAADDEGLLTVLRSQATSGRALAKLARGLDLGAYLRLGRGEQLAGGRRRASLLADSMEAVFGAVWLDGGHAAARGVFDRLLAPVLAGLTHDRWGDNPKGRLQELAQGRFQTVPVYQVIETSGPDHEPAYRVSVTVAGGGEAQGAGRSKREAECDAARALLRDI